MIQHTYENGNSIEKSLCNLLREHFSNYEEYRSRFLIPLTGHPWDSNWRADTHPELERIGVASFGILKSINFIFIKKHLIGVSSNPDQNFKNIYFHFGLAIDCVNAVFRSTVMILSHLKVINFNKMLRLSEEKLIKDFKNWAAKDYNKRFDEMINAGKPILYYPQNDHSFIKLIVTNKTLRSQYLDIVKEIKDYRNFFIHNPGVDVFVDRRNGEKFAIRKDAVQKSQNWATLRNLYHIDKTLFINPTTMVESDLIILLNSLNIIWTHVIEVLDRIYNHDNFPLLFKDYNRNIY